LSKKAVRKKAKSSEFSDKRMDEVNLSYLLFQSQDLEMFDEREIEKIRGDIEQKFSDALRVINEETLQLSEFLIEDKKLAKELCRLIRPVLERLDLSFVIPAEAIPIFKKTDRIILNETGHLIFVYEKTKVSSKPLEEYSPKIVLAVFLIIIPELGRSMRSYRKTISMRINFFERMYRELESINRAFATSKENAEESSEEHIEENENKKPFFSKREAAHSNKQTEVGP